MPDQTAGSAAAEQPVEATAQPSTDDVVTEDLLVEEVSIDGMCGVY